MNRSALITTLIPALGIAYLLYAYAALPSTDLRILGLILALAGLAGVAVARAQLGISFTLAPEARALVTHGIYSKVRNPVYLFSAIAIAGLLLYINRLSFFWIFLLIIPLQVIRARI